MSIFKFKKTKQTDGLQQQGQTELVPATKGESNEPTSAIYIALCKAMELPTERERLLAITALVHPYKLDSFPDENVEAYKDGYDKCKNGVIKIKIKLSAAINYYFTKHGNR